jgi:hypothetical protein
MKAENHNIDRQWLLAYVLGDLSENETRVADERFFSDEAFAVALDETYRDLLDDYAAQTIPAAERERVERAFFSGPYEDQRLAVLKAMQSFTRNPPSGARNAELRLQASRRSFWPLAASAFALGLTVVALLAFVYLRKSYTSPMRNVSNESAATRPAEPLASPPLAATPSASTSPANSESAFTILLLPDVTRGTEAAEPFSVPPATATVSFQIVLPGNVSGGTFDVRLGSAKGTESRPVNGLTAKKLDGQTYVEFAVPAAGLPAGEYRVDVFASGAAKRPLEHFALRIARAAALQRQP